MGKLLLVRHGESEWNKLGIWTGITDVALSEKGFEEARKVGDILRGTKIDFAFVADMIRAQQTFDSLCERLRYVPPFEKAPALNERDYGIYTRKSKWEVKEQIGDDEFLKLRRGWDTPVPGGETLKDVYNRVVPYYMSVILPHLIQGETVLISAHGNSLRSLMKFIEKASDEDIAHIEIGIGQVVEYEINDEGTILGKTPLNESYSP
jgi:2,3-bisphosphoglycerate-dependent phosphoglycerate mutase